MPTRLHGDLRTGLTRSLAALGAALSLSACATAPLAPTSHRLVSASRTRIRAYNRPYQVRGRWYTPVDQPGYDRIGLASWYSYESRSRTTANGEPFDVSIPTAAHTTLPIPSWLEVTNLDNGRRLRVRLNDRGPFVPGRILDVSRAAADQLGFLQRGTARVRVQYLGPAGPSGLNPPMWAKSDPPPSVVRARPQPLQLARAAPTPMVDPAAEVAEDLGDTAGEGLAPPSPPQDYEPAEIAYTPAPRPAAETSPPDGQFLVQAGAFADRSNAERAAERLALTGQTSIRPLEREGAPVLYRVVVGAWTQTEAAQSARSRIAALGFADAKVLVP